MSSPDYIREYLEQKFKDKYKISSNGEEFIVPSLFHENDYKRHMSINSTTGLWQCFKSGETGNFTALYARLEEKTYKRAAAELLLQELQNTPAQIVSPTGFNTQYDPQDLLSEEDPFLIPIHINSYESEDEMVLKAWKFLMDRQAFNIDEFEDEPFYLVKEGTYRNRILIPFRNEEGEMFFFQARALYSDMKPKYLNPPSAKGVHARHVLYPYDETAESLYICEGPFDAITLNLLGFNATCTIGNNISQTQIEILKEFEGKFILAYDNDDAGKIGLKKFDSIRRTNLMPNFKVVFPPDPYKDWNEAYLKGSDIPNWIFHNTEEYSYFYGMENIMDKINNPVTGCPDDMPLRPRNMP